MNIKEVISLVNSIESYHQVDFEEDGGSYVITLSEYQTGDIAKLLYYRLGYNSKLIQLPIEGNRDVSYVVSRVSDEFLLLNMLKLFKLSGFKIITEFI